MVRRATALLFAAYACLSMINECSEEEAATLFPVIEAVLNALRTNKGIKIE